MALFCLVAGALCTWAAAADGQSFAQGGFDQFNVPATPQGTGKEGYAVQPSDAPASGPANTVPLWQSLFNSGASVMVGTDPANGL